MFCYWTDRKSAPNLWTELPHYIAFVVGYSKTTGRTYFRGNGAKALFSTYDGQLIELTSESELPGDINPSVPVPGVNRQDVNVPIAGNFTGDCKTESNLSSLKYSCMKIVSNRKGRLSISPPQTCRMSVENFFLHKQPDLPKRPIFAFISYKA